MARAPLSESDVSAFRARMVDEAMRLFAEQGWGAVSMRTLAGALGVSAMTPYRYVAGKDELLALLRTEAFRRFADAMEAAEKRSRERGARDRLAALQRAYIAFAVKEPDAYRVMFELEQDAPAAWPRLAEEGKRAFMPLFRAASAAVDEGRFEQDALSVAHVLWAATHGLVTLHLAGKLSMGRPLEQLAASALAMHLPPRNARKPRPARSGKEKRR